MQRNFGFLIQSPPYKQPKQEATLLHPCGPAGIDAYLFRPASPPLPPAPARAGARATSCQGDPLSAGPPSQTGGLGIGGALGPRKCKLMAGGPAGGLRTGRRGAASERTGCTRRGEYIVLNVQDAAGVAATAGDRVLLAAAAALNELAPVIFG